MTDTSYSCPTGLNLTSYSKRTCGRSHLDSGCSSTTFDVGGLPYSQVCGRIKGYQFGATSAFYDIFNQGIDGIYVEGVSLTHGRPGNREHIWTFVAGLTESENDRLYWYNAHCPCDRTPNHVINVPPYMHLLEMTTSVRVVCTLPGIFSSLFFPMTHCGTDRTVQLPAHVVSSTILHGLQRH